MRIETIQELAEANQIVWTKHVRDRIRQRGILQEEILDGIWNGEIIENYPDSYPYPSCLIWAKILDEKIIHIVIGYDGDLVYVISVYIPSAEKFEKDFKIRRKI